MFGISPFSSAILPPPLPSHSYQNLASLKTGGQSKVLEVVNVMHAESEKSMSLVKLKLHGRYL